MNADAAEEKLHHVLKDGEFNRVLRVQESQINEL